MMSFLALQIAAAAVEFVDAELGNLDNGRKKEAALEFARTELMNLQAAGKLGRRNDGTDTIAAIMPLINEAIDVAVLITHSLRKKKAGVQIDPQQAAIDKVKPAQQGKASAAGLKKS